MPDVLLDKACVAQITILIPTDVHPAKRGIILNQPQVSMVFEQVVASSPVLRRVPTADEIHPNLLLDARGIVHRLGNSQFYEFVKRFGYGQRTGSGCPGESAGVFPAPDRWDGTSKQPMSYGYALSVTPLQIATAYAALGNGGKLIPPSFIKGQHGEPRQVLDPKIAGEVLRMMQTVTEPGGTATQAAILGYHVAGKTGTSRKASAGGYSRRYIGYFAGLVPVDKPRFAMVVMVNDPDPGRKGYTGGSVSAPVFRNTMEGALRLMDVAPDNLETWLAAQAAAEAKRKPANATTAPVLPTPVAAGSRAPQ